MVGGKKLYRMLMDTNDPKLVIGRDHLFDLLRANGLLIDKKTAFINTTDFKHDLPVSPNLLPETFIDRINQAWVVDITYLNTCDGFVFLYLVTDLFSRKIIAYTVTDNLRAESACMALKKALKTVSDASGIIHHSDHGSQYCSKLYQDILRANNLQSSMTGKNRCFDNAVAERVNGILKHEFGLKRKFPSLQIARESAADAINIYNSIRLHLALNYHTPDYVYRKRKENAA
jgi:putative transposase